MNVHRVLQNPIMELMMIGLSLLAVGGVAILRSAVWSLIHVPSSSSPTQADPLKMVSAFHAAVNSNNVDSMLALFTEDAIISDSGSIIRGRDEIRNWVLHAQRMAGLQITMLHSEIHKDTITWIDGAHNAAGVDQKAYLLQWVAVIQNDKIRSLTVSLLPMPDGK